MSATRSSRVFRSSREPDDAAGPRSGALDPDPALADIAESRAFYRDRLGFETVAPNMDAYLIVRRGEIEIHFRLTPNRDLPKVSSCYIRGGEISRLHAEFSERAVPGLTPLTLLPWNMKEFYIHDPHGNLLRFGCIPEEA